MLCSLGATGDGPDARCVLSLPRAVVVRHIAVGVSHSAALSSAGDVYTWGVGDNGRLGHGSTESVKVPVLVRALSNVPCLALACGARHTIVVGINGEVYSWGSNSFGALGLGDSNDGDHVLPQRIAGLAGRPIVQVRAARIRKASR